MTEQAANLLRSWLLRQLSMPSAEWLTEQLEIIQGDPSDRNLHILLGMIPRRLGKDDLDLNAVDLAEADAVRSGWDPNEWSVDVAARVLALLGLASDGVSFARCFSDLCGSADIVEAIALYSGLPLYPSPELLEPQAAEGVRTNMRAEFEAVAHRNPFPREQFDENRWNHMLLKALFIGSTLAPIQGLDERANPELARILCDYAHERWAAGRMVTPELWRCVGPFAEGEALLDLERVLTTGEEVERRAAALAVTSNPSKDARALQGHLHVFQSAISSGALTWNSLTHKL